MYFKIIFLITLIVLIKFCCINGQVALGGQQSDRTQQELALLGWTSGVRMAYCQQIAVIDLVDPFREAIARMLNRHCRTPTVCGIKKRFYFLVSIFLNYFSHFSVTFNKFQVVMLDSKF
ncbi:unnamed protein product [Meloidogyne enterolobii]|uniref:Uncharacterized protein n=1 Tax=Meloidogyne enterolobii TaxID=390850 RepID=A0ACB1AY40_MELEN